MEGNDCYKFRTIARYLEATGEPPIRVALDIGCNLGTMSLMMRRFFPDAEIYAFEPVTAYYNHARERLAALTDVHVFRRAVCASHLYRDDLGREPLAEARELTLYNALEMSGPGWVGGSFVFPKDPSNRFDPKMYADSEERVTAATLDEVVTGALALSGRSEIDYIKFDCEGGECSAIGCAAAETLRRIRFISGEYHGVDRFYNVMKHRLYATHRVNLVGGPVNGSFFAERLDTTPGVLSHDREGMLQSRPELSSQPLDWHIFNPAFVPDDDLAAHGIG